MTNYLSKQAQQDLEAFRAFDRIIKAQAGELYCYKLKERGETFYKHNMLKVNREIANAFTDYANVYGDPSRLLKALPSWVEFATDA